jgi:hypothetical protein
MLRLIIRAYSWTVFADLSGVVASSHRSSRSPRLSENKQVSHAWRDARVTDSDGLEKRSPALLPTAI